MHSPSSGDQLSEVTYVSPHQTTVSEAHEDFFKVPFLSVYPVCSKRLIRYLHFNSAKAFSSYDQFPALIHQTFCLQIGETKLGSNPWPINQSNFGSDHDSLYCSPHPPPYAQPVFAPTLGFAPAKRTHTNSDVSTRPQLSMSICNDEYEAPTSSESRSPACVP